MTPQERDLILAVAQRLRGAPPMNKDQEADQFIRSTIGTLPDALYQLTQAVIVQEQGLRHAQERIQQLETAAQQAPAQHSFLGGLFGGSSPPPQPAPPPVPAAGPPSGSGFGTFLKTAAGAAAGVVGGQLIWDGLRHLGGGPGAVSGAMPWSTPQRPTADWGSGGSFATPDTSVDPQSNDYSGGSFGQDTDAATQDDSGDVQGGGGDFDTDQDQDAQDDGDGGDFGGDDSDNSGGGDF
jgi:hypothetical protein